MNRCVNQVQNRTINAIYEIKWKFEYIWNISRVFTFFTQLMLLLLWKRNKKRLGENNHNDHKNDKKLVANHAYELTISTGDSYQRLRWTEIVWCSWASYSAQIPQPI